jgi:hypothetical protein
MARINPEGIESLNQAIKGQKKVFRFLPEMECKVLCNYFVVDGALGVVGLGAGLG